MWHNADKMLAISTDRGSNILPVEDLLCLQQELHVPEEHSPIYRHEEFEDHQVGLVEVMS
jgi:hypothetical protein